MKEEKIKLHLLEKKSEEFQCFARFVIEDSEEF